MTTIGNRIQNLLYLQQPFTVSLADNLRLGCESLLSLHDGFSEVARELRVWTFYETINSLASGEGSGAEVRFAAPLVSIKSAIIGVKQERVFGLHSAHAHPGTGTGSLLVWWPGCLVA